MRLLLTFLLCVLATQAAPSPSTIGGIRVSTDTTGTNTIAANMQATNLTGATPRTGIMLRDLQATNSVKILSLTASRPAYVGSDKTITNGLPSAGGTLYFDTVADMVDAPVDSGVDVAIVSGRVAKNDGGGGTFTLNGTPSATNLGTVFPASNGGSWNRQYDGDLNVVWFGAIPDDLVDDAEAIQAAIDASTTTGPVVYFPDGTFIVSETLTTLRRGTYVGASRSSTFLSFRPTVQSALWNIPINSDNIVFQNLNMVNGLTSGSIGTMGVACTNGTSSTRLYFFRNNFEKFTLGGFYSPSSFYVTAIDNTFFRIKNDTAYGGTGGASGATAFKIDNNANAVWLLLNNFADCDQFIDLIYGYNAVIKANTFEQGNSGDRVGFTPGYFIDIGISSYVNLDFTGNYIEGNHTATNRATMRLQNCLSPTVDANVWLSSYGGTNWTHNFIEVGTNVFNFTPTGNTFEDQINEAVSTPSTSYAWVWKNTYRRNGGVLTTKIETYPYLGANCLLDGDDLTFPGADYGYDWWTASPFTNQVVYARMRTSNTTATPVSSGYGFGLRVDLPRDNGSVGQIGALDWVYTQATAGGEDVDLIVQLARDSSVAERLRVTSDGYVQAYGVRATNSVEVGLNNYAGLLTLNNTNAGNSVKWYVTSGGALAITNNSTLVDTLEASSGYTGGGTNVRVDNGTYVTPASLGLIPNPTNYVGLVLGNPNNPVELGSTNFFVVPEGSTLKTVTAHLFVTSSSGSVTIDLKKNGTTMLSAPVSIAAGATNTTATVSVTTMGVNDRIAGEVTAEGTDAYGAYLNIGFTTP